MYGDFAFRNLVAAVVLGVIGLVVWIVLRALGCAG